MQQLGGPLYRLGPQLLGQQVDLQRMGGHTHGRMQLQCVWQCFWRRWRAVDPITTTHTHTFRKTVHATDTHDCTLLRATTSCLAAISPTTRHSAVCAWMPEAAWQCGRARFVRQRDLGAKRGRGRERERPLQRCRGCYDLHPPPHAPPPSYD